MEDVSISVVCMSSMREVAESARSLAIALALHLDMDEDNHPEIFAAYCETADALATLDAIEAL